MRTAFFVATTTSSHTKVSLSHLLTIPFDLQILAAREQHLKARTSVDCYLPGLTIAFLKRRKHKNLAISTKTVAQVWFHWQESVIICRPVVDQATLRWWAFLLVNLLNWAVSLRPRRLIVWWDWEAGRCQDMIIISVTWSAHQSNSDVFPEERQWR